MYQAIINALYPPCNSSGVYDVYSTFKGLLFYKTSILKSKFAGGGFFFGG